MIALILLGAAVVFLAIYGSTKHLDLPQNQPMPWQSFVNPQGQTVALGLTIGQSTLAQSMRIFGNESEVSLFENNAKTTQTNPTLEVFFASTKVGGLSTKVILNLRFTAAQLAFFKYHIKQIERTPTGQKISLDYLAEAKLFDLVIDAMSLMPSADLTPTMLTERFGKPKRVEVSVNGVEFWHYPAKGLRIIVSAAGKEILEFYNVSNPSHPTNSEASRR